MEDSQPDHREFAALHDRLGQRIPNPEPGAQQAQRYSFVRVFLVLDEDVKEELPFTSGDGRGRERRVVHGRAQRMCHRLLEHGQVANGNQTRIERIEGQGRRNLRRLHGGKAQGLRSEKAMRHARGRGLDGPGNTIVGEKHPKNRWAKKTGVPKDTG